MRNFLSRINEPDGADQRVTAIRRPQPGINNISHSERRGLCSRNLVNCGDLQDGVCKKLPGFHSKTAPCFVRWGGIGRVDSLGSSIPKSARFPRWVISQRSPSRQSAVFKKIETPTQALEKLAAIDAAHDTALFRRSAHCRSHWTSSTVFRHRDSPLLSSGSRAPLEGGIERNPESSPFSRI